MVEPSQSRPAHDAKDSLTGLAGGAAALCAIGQWQDCSASRGQRAPIHSMLICLNRYGAVNLAYGRAAGDAALVEVSARILHFAREELGQRWHLARISGETFLLAASEACSRERWQWLAEELAQAIAQPINASTTGRAVRLWPRIALSRSIPDEAPDIMLVRLQDALDRNRQQSGNRLNWVDGAATFSGRPARQLEADLISALDQGEIEIVYQPQFASVSGEMVGAEALARWQHPQLGLIGAGALFAIAERADHTPQLSRHIMRAALAGARHWPPYLRLSINVMPVDLANRHFADGMEQALHEAGFPAERLTLEITEQALVADLDQSAGQLRQLAAIGVRIALDDFGAGFCNFRYLKLLPLHYLKLDRSMVDGIADDPRDLAVLRGIVAMAHALELAVIAEGVESEAQRATVAGEGCDVWQGFLGAEPMSARALLDLAGDLAAGTP